MNNDNKLLEFNSTCSVTGVADGAGGSGAKSKNCIDTPIKDPF